MNWKVEAIEELKSYPDKKAFLDEFPEQLQSLLDDYQSIRAGQTDGAFVQGGCGRQEDKLINNIVKRDKLTFHYRAAKASVKKIERALSALTGQQRAVLDAFYISRETGHVERLEEALHLERTRVYQLKDDALLRFTKRMYGFTES